MPPAGGYAVQSSEMMNAPAAMTWPAPVIAIPNASFNADKPLIR
jgi:hypothetical protein